MASPRGTASAHQTLRRRGGVWLAAMVLATLSLLWMLSFVALGLYEPLEMDTLSVKAPLHSQDVAWLRGATTGPHPQPDTEPNTQQEDRDELVEETPKPKPKRKKSKQKHKRTSAPPPLPSPPVVSVLHARTTPMPPLGNRPRFDLRMPEPLEDQPHVFESTEYFAQYGKEQKGVHYRLQNSVVLSKPQHLTDDALLVVVVLNDHASWGKNRSVDDFFELLETITHPKTATSLTLLTSDLDEFQRIQTSMKSRIRRYAQFSLILRNDFPAGVKLTRANRHQHKLQAQRRRMLARYRNFALLSTLETWHQHVVWLDADVFRIPPGLVTKMVEADRDVLVPVCYKGTREYDKNSWVGTRKKRVSDPDKHEAFVPNLLDAHHLGHYRRGIEDFVPLDSVGGTMLYVRADVHRQGVLFPHHYVIGSEWDQEGYDGIETEGLCYEAHFLGFTCWGMPHDFIHHVNTRTRGHYR